ncbi:MAG: TlpA disulfide reductase family protein [Candidatus Pseudobacter hemicellulosilyticus]|uniref:TlpA disulfide reductase family protein n=1 Tax=Candidatus Pseudobacter hemicellulosilyticus TaxID=3121375 RepID=A0AAJ6BDY5_9BACT|nr:MAG: TlpA disulfide reductase family protein [Pseudobacter sp.]
MKAIIFFMLLWPVCGALAHEGGTATGKNPSIADTTGLGRPAVFSLTSPDGTVYNSGDLKGKVLVLDFWATWCAPCRKLTHEMDSLLTAYHQKKDFLMIGVDYRETNTAAAAAYWKEQGVPVPDGR